MEAGYGPGVGSLVHSRHSVSGGSLKGRHVCLWPLRASELPGEHSCYGKAWAGALEVEALGSGVFPSGRLANPDTYQVCSPEYPRVSCCGASQREDVETFSLPLTCPTSNRNSLGVSGP